MIIDQHVVFAGGIVGIDILAASVRINLVSHQRVVMFGIAFEKQNHTNPFFATTSNGLFVIVVVIFWVFSALGKITITSGGTSGSPPAWTKMSMRLLNFTRKSEFVMSSLWRNLMCAASAL